jgi:hypothetical protein
MTQSIIMYKAIAPFLLLLCSLALQAQQTVMTNEDLMGEWKVTAITLRGKTISLKRGDSLRAFLKEINDSIKMETNTNTPLKSGFNRLMIANMLQSRHQHTEIWFKADKTYYLSTGESYGKGMERGDWLLDEIAQTLQLSPRKKRNDARPEDSEFIIQGHQLILQMGEHSMEEALVFTKRK